MKICFYGGGIYDALIGNPPGGAELQVALIAKALSEKGHRVTVIDNKGNGFEKKVKKIIILFTAKSKIKWLRFIFEKVPNSVRFLHKENADFYYVRGYAYLFLIPAIIARIKKSIFVVGIGSDIDVMSFTDRFLYVFKKKTSFSNWLRNDLPSCLIAPILFKMAKIVLVQHEGQQNKLSKRKINSVVFPNIFYLNHSLVQPVKKDFYIIVGSLNERKGLSELLTLIEKNPGIKIKIVGQPQGSSAAEKIKTLEKYSNVISLGQKKREETLSEISKSKGLLNLSKMEGFPNTFMEAWHCGIPVYSLWVDPGGVIEKFNLGRCFGGNLDSMATFLKNNKTIGQTEHIKEYVSLNHSYDKAAIRFLNAISAIN